MQKALTSFVLSLVTLAPLWALAAVSDEGGANAPVETVSAGVIVLFGVLFIGAIVGFFVYMWWLSKKEKSDK